jgi:superfamily II DNA or RNA helicase
MSGEMELDHDRTRPWVNLYPHQKDGEAAVLGRFDAGVKSGVVIMATGTGKTIMGGSVARKMVEWDGRPVLWLAHRTQLITQAIEDLAECGLEAAREQGRESALSSPQPSVICRPSRQRIRKKLENPRSYWNNRGENTSSLFQTAEAFE